MSFPEIFVLVPSYNHAPYVERCLQSIIKQTLSPTKLLVIDDGSRDESVKIIEQTLKNCPFPCEVVARENRGLCRTLNEGFGQSFGEYFAYLGSDDVWLPDFLESRVRMLETNKKAVIAYGNAFLIDEQDRIIESSADWDGYKFNNDRKMLLLGIAPVSSTVFYRRSALAEIPWNETARLEDYEMYLKLSAVGDFVFDREVRAAWRQHDYNTSGDMPLMLREVLEALERSAENLKINRDDLRKIKSEVSFRYAEDFVRRGRKRQAFNLARENWRNASSSAALAKIAFRLLLPMSLVRLRKKYLSQQTAERYGTLRI